MAVSRRDLWTRRMDRYRACSLTVKEFCRGEGVSVPSFYQWKKKLALAPASPAFVPVAFTRGPATTAQGPATTAQGPATAAQGPGGSLSLVQDAAAPVSLPQELGAPVTVKLPGGAKVQFEATANPTTLRRVLAAVIAETNTQSHTQTNAESQP